MRVRKDPAKFPSPKIKKTTDELLQECREKKRPKIGANSILRARVWGGLWLDNKVRILTVICCHAVQQRLDSGKKQEPKPELFGPDIFRWGGGLLRERVGPKKFGMFFEAQGKQTFGRDIPGLWPGYPGIARKVWES